MRQRACACGVDRGRASSGRTAAGEKGHERPEELHDGRPAGAACAQLGDEDVRKVERDAQSVESVVSLNEGPQGRKSATDWARFGLPQKEAGRVGDGLGGAGGRGVEGWWAGRWRGWRKSMQDTDGVGNAGVGGARQENAIAKEVGHAGEQIGVPAARHGSREWARAARDGTRCRIVMISTTADKMAQAHHSRAAT